MNKQLLTLVAVVVALLSGVMMVSLVGRSSKSAVKSVAPSAVNPPSSSQPTITQSKPEQSNKTINARVIIPNNQIKAKVNIVTDKE